MRLLRLIPCTHSLRPRFWFEDLLLKRYVTWPTKHTADKGESTILNHAIKMEIKGSKALLEFSQGCSSSVFLSRLSSYLWALAVSTGLFTPLSILTLIWSGLILHAFLYVILCLCSFRCWFVLFLPLRVSNPVSHVLGRNFTTKSHPESNLVLNFWDGILLWRLGCSQTRDFSATASLVLPL